jgi:competence protein ComEC
MFALVALAIARWVWRVGVWRYVRIPRETFASALGLAASTAYSMLAGFSVPTQRTLLMLAVWFGVRASARTCGPLTTLSIALIAVVLLDPFAPLAAGFWLSFGAIATIICVTVGRVGEPVKWRAAINVQLAVSLALAPITILCFGSVPITGLLVNLAAIPFFGFVLVPTVLLAVVTSSGLLLDLAARLYAYMWLVMSWAADLPIALFYVSPTFVWYVLAAASIGASLLPLPLRLRAACLIGLIPLAVAPSPSPLAGTFAATLLDVGDRTAVILRTENHVVFYGDEDVFAGNIVIPFLRSEGVKSEDVEHLGGEPTIRQLDGVGFRVQCTSAQSSCVMHVTTSHGSLLLTHRLDSTAELEWVRLGLSPADVVIVPRHGASSASSEPFIAATKARWALLPGNARIHGQNRPAVTRWRANHARVLATADSGAIRVQVDPVTGLLSPVATREHSHALWRALPSGRRRPV